MINTCFALLLGAIRATTYYEAVELDPPPSSPQETHVVRNFGGLLKSWLWLQGSLT